MFLLRIYTKILFEPKPFISHLKQTLAMSKEDKLSKSTISQWMTFYHHSGNFKKKGNQNEEEKIILVDLFANDQIIQ